MKRHFFKFLLSLVRALVIMKRLFVWLAQTVGRFFAWILHPAVLYLIVPLYQVVRRYIRRYQELSEDPWERRRRVAMSRPFVTLLLFVSVFSVSRVAVATSTQPGVVPGAQSILFTRVFIKEASDWHIDDGLGASDDFAQLSQQPTITYRGGGAIAYVFPYNGSVGRAPTAPEPEPPVDSGPRQTQPYQKYAVQRGDTIARIAQRFKLKIETVLWANNLKSTSVLRPGDTLTIPAVDGVLYTVKSGGQTTDVAKIFNIPAKTIAQANNIATNTALKRGQVLLIPGGKPLAGEPQPPKVATPAPPKQQIQPEPEPEPQPQPQPTTPEPTAPVIKPPPSTATGKMIWPTRRRSVTQYYSARHQGLDIDGDYTDPVYASDSGVVTFSGWNNSGYGNMVLIDHGNGIQSRYAHNSRVYVKVGQEVSKGDVIAMVGTTGRSTGTHLHFEIMVNGRRVNPFTYTR